MRLRWHWKRYSMALAAVVFVACLGLFIKAYNNSGSTGSGGNGAAGSSNSPGAYPSSGPSGRASGSKAPGPFAGVAGLPTGKPSLVDAFGNLIPRLRVSLSASSGSSISVVGYLVPTSLNSPYGVVKNPGHSWGQVADASGPGPWAAIFVQAGPDGTPVTCSVTVNGRTITQTTKGAYGQQVCVG